MILVISGPSGAGKGTVIEEVRRLDPTIGLPVSCTTRPPRPGEVNGKDYHFVSDGRFNELRDKGEFIEYERVHGRYYYGTLCSEIKEGISGAKDIILDLDCKGALKLREKLVTPFLFFLLPPTRGELERRIRTRGRESDEKEIAERLSSADREMSCARLYNGWMINEDLDTTVSSVLKVIGSLRKKEQPDWERFYNPYVLDQALDAFSPA